MSRLLTIAPAALILAVAVLAPANAADDDSKFAGLWQENQDGYKVVWCIGYWNGKWSASAATYQEGKKVRKGRTVKVGETKKVGSWQGTDVRFADGKLTFTRKLGDAAPETVTIQAGGGDQLSYTTDKGGTGRLTRSTDIALAPDLLPSKDDKSVVADKGKPGPNPVRPNPGDKPGPAVVKPPESAKKYAGTWLGDKEVDGYRSVWTIRINDDNATVSITYFDPKRKKTTCYITGDKVGFEDGKLVFNQKMSPNCPGHWFRNVKTTVEMDKDRLSFSGFGHGGSLARLSEADITAGYVGTWGCEVDGYQEVVIVKKSRTRWQIGATLLRGGRTVSGWSAQDIKFTDGKLTFTQKLRTNAPSGWPDRSQFTMVWDGDSLNCNWVNGDKKGERSLKLLSK